MTDRTVEERHEPMITRSCRGAWAHCSCGWRGGAWDVRGASLRWALHVRDAADRG